MLGKRTLPSHMSRPPKGDTNLTASRSASAVSTDGIRVSWKDNFEYHYTEVVELGRCVYLHDDAGCHVLLGGEVGGVDLKAKALKVRPLSRQGSFFRGQVLRPAGHQAHAGGQTREQEADEEGSGDSGAQPAHESPAPQHHLPGGHVRDPQQLRPGAGDVRAHQIHLIFPSNEWPLVYTGVSFNQLDVAVPFQGRPGSPAGLRGELGESDGGESSLLPPGCFRSFTLPA